MTQKKAKQIDLVSGNGVRLRIAYKGGRVLLRFVDLIHFLRALGIATSVERFDPVETTRR
jgi:hypothetical protein